jgi:hypothetical protein
MLLLLNGRLRMIAVSLLTAFMSLLVSSQVALLVKYLGTSKDLAFERLLSSVNSHMNLHVIVQTESLVTLLTLEWLLSCVDDVVPLELILINKH